MRKLLGAAFVVWFSTAAEAAQFTLTLSNTGTNSAYGWSTGLLTTRVLLPLGLTPQPTSQAYSAYSFANSNCNISDAYCSGSCSDNGNATVLAQRQGLTLGVDAWLVPAIPTGSSTTVTVDVPAGSRLSYFAWVNNTSVFDDFVAMHPVGSPTTLSIPLFDSGGQPLQNISFELSGYDSNSTSATDGSGGTCTPSCPTAATGCYVAVGNASVGSSGSYPTPTTVSDVRNLTALSGSGTNKLTWTNVAPHDGVLVVRRAGAAPTFSPRAGRTYTVGSRVAGSQSDPEIAVYAEYGSTVANTFTDTGLTNGTRYYYKVFAHAFGRTYASGNVPGTSGIWSIPTTTVSPSPKWCYSVGFAGSMQPVLGVTSPVYAAFNTVGVIANNPDGSERFRPTTLPGTVQGRFLAWNLLGHTGLRLIVGDQSGSVHLVDATTGSVVRSRSVATMIQAMPTGQLSSSSNAAFQARFPGRDVLFIASRNGTSNNTVTALSSVDLSQEWQYAPGNLGIISGGMLLDRPNNRLWVASRAPAGAPTVRVLSTLDGSVQATFSIGDVDAAVGWGYGQNEALVTTVSGSVYAFNLTSLTQSWSYASGATNGAVFPTGDGFIASLSGSVQRYLVDPTTKAVTAMWSPAPAVTNPTGVRVDYVAQKVLVGSSSGNLYQLNAATGAIEKTVPVSATGISAPHVDPRLSPQLLYVSGLDGRLCAFALPL